MSSSDSDEALKNQSSPRSLKELQDNQRKLKSQFRELESRHDFYLSMWKSAPYAAIALVPATAYAYLVDPIYSVGLAAAAIVVLIVGLAGWTTQKSLNTEMTSTQLEAEDVNRQLERRVLKVEVEFMNMRPNSQLCYYENQLFDENMFYQKPGDFATQVPRQLLADMKTMDPDLLQLHKDFYAESGREFERLVEFRAASIKKLAAIDKQLAIVAPQPQERTPSQIQGLFLVLSGIVVSPQDVIQKPGERSRILVPRPAIAHFIQLLFESDDEKNPYPSLLRDAYLKSLATDLEATRREALRIFTAIEHITKVKYGEVPGFERVITR